MLNYGEIESHQEGISNIKAFINKCKWNGINYPLKIDDWKTSEKNNPTISLNILDIKEKEICPAYFSKINSYFEKQIIILMTPKKQKEGWHDLAVKKINCITTWNNLLFALLSFF